MKSVSVRCAVLVTPQTIATKLLNLCFFFFNRHVCGLTYFENLLTWASLKRSVSDRGGKEELRLNSTPAFRLMPSACRGAAGNEWARIFY